MTLPRAPKGGWPRKVKDNLRRFTVAGVDLGDGRRCTCWLLVGRGEVVVKRVRSRRAWSLPLAEAAGAVARRAQRLAIERRT